MQAQYKVHEIFKENIAVFTSRDIFIAGEEIRFTVFTVGTFSNKPVNFSNYAYVELVNTDNTTVHKSQIKIANNSGIGTIPLDNSLPTGNYALRIYTQWMRNYNSEDITFLKVINPYQTLNASEVNKISPAALSIFPEGGLLSSSLKNKIWFSISMPDMRTDKMQLQLFEDDSLINTYAAQYKNIGNLSLQPQQNMSYRLELVDENNKIIDRKILSFSDDAGILKAEKNSDSYTITVEFPVKNTRFIKLVSNGSVFWEEKLTGSRYEKNLELSDLPHGISFILITNEQNEIQNWRPLKVNTIENIVLPPTYLTSGTDALQNMEILLNMKAESINEVALTMHPYLEEKTLSNVMEYEVMVHPFWQQKPTETDIFTFRFNPELKKSNISGTLKHFSSGKPAANTDLHISVLQPEIAYRYVRTDSTGNYNLQYEPLPKKTQFIFYTNPGEEYLLTLDDKYTGKQNSIQFPFFHLSDEEKKLVENLVLNQQINMAYNMHLQEASTMDAKTNNNPYFFYGKPDETLRMQKYISLPTMEEVFRELSRAIFLTKVKGQLKVNILDKYENRVIGPEPYIFIDGILVKDHSLIFELDPAIVESISLLESRYYYGDLIMDGIMDIRTKNKDISIVEYFTFYSTYEQEGISVSDFAPDLQQQIAEQNLPFYPNNLWWDLNESGKEISNLSLPVPNKTGAYILTLYGIEDEGNIITKSRIINVN